MSKDPCLATPIDPRLTAGPLREIVTPYLETLRAGRYATRTIQVYLDCLAQFADWVQAEGITASGIDKALIERYLRGPYAAPSRPRNGITNARAALRCALRVLAPTLMPATDPRAIELAGFGAYLGEVCGLAGATRKERLRHVGTFLGRAFGANAPVIGQITARQVEAIIADWGARWQPSALRVVCGSLRSYFRYRATLGDVTATLEAALPRLADWRGAALPKVLSDEEVERFLRAFDGTDPVGQRDYAIARCLLDLGLRGHEVTSLTLESVDWRAATLTLPNPKGRRMQRLPLPASTGAAIAHYLREGRPRTVHRALFVRHRAPFDTPLGVPAIRSAMTRAFVRCGLGGRFCSTHVLRRTLATRLQRSGASVKEIADLLRHQDLDTARAYVRVDIEALRAVALPWPGSRS
ncbi:MAG: site-specific integrase [Gammaproteobacteria bacterium]|jgi:site-specific recombinase XerD|nr:site-specific integrase [Gammaproteobacteria bacterium]